MARDDRSTPTDRLRAPTERTAAERTAALDADWHTARTGAHSADAPPDRARVTFLGHSTVLLEVDRLRILTDPILGLWLGPIRRYTAPIPTALFQDLDAIFLSHGHHDHLDLGSLRRIPGRPTIIAPRGLGQMLQRAGLGPVEEVEAGERLVIDEVHFEVVHAEHDGGRRPFGPAAPSIGCIVRGSRSVYFAGDTEIFDGMATFGALDLALLPVWGWGPTIGPGHMNPERAARAAGILRPRLAIPIHWGTLYPVGLLSLLRQPFVSPGPEFAEAAAEHAPGVDVRILAPGASLDLPMPNASGDAGGAGRG